MSSCPNTDDWCRRLYEAKAAQLLLYGRALGLSHSEAEDVLQETFVALLALPMEPPQPEFYCISAFRNRCSNFRRSLWRRLKREIESTRWFERDSEANPAEESAMKCLAKLPTEQREVIVLKIWHELTFELIGEMLGISPNTASGRYRYGMKKLRECLTTHATHENESTGTFGEDGIKLEASAAR